MKYPHADSPCLVFTQRFRTINWIFGAGKRRYTLPTLHEATCEEQRITFIWEPLSGGVSYKPNLTYKNCKTDYFMSFGINFLKQFYTLILSPE